MWRIYIQADTGPVGILFMRDFIPSLKLFLICETAVSKLCCMLYIHLEKLAALIVNNFPRRHFFAEI